MHKSVPASREDDSWFSDEQLARLSPAEAEAFCSPVPTRMVSNGEYMPFVQTEQQKRVEARTKELAEAASKKLGISRRQFLAGTGGLAASFLAMNEVFGRFFNVSPVEMFERQAFAANGVPSNLFVFDDQTHMVRSTLNNPRGLRAIAQGPGPASTVAGFLTNPNNPLGQLDELGSPWTPWNPSLGQTPNVGSEFHLAKYIQRMYLESQTTVAILSNVTPGTVLLPGEAEPRPPKSIPESLAGSILTTEQTVAVRDFVNEIAGSTRLLGHGLFFPGVGNLEYMQFQIDNYNPDSWKGYNHNRAAKVDFDPESDMRRWRMDDEVVVYPTYELIAKNRPEVKRNPGFWNICVHKGLSTNAGPEPELGHPADIPKAATDWPQLNFIYYHSCIRPGFWVFNALQDIQSGRTREGVPDILWTTEFAILSEPFPNVYAEIGTTWASSVVTFPTVAAHIMGQLLKFMGERRIVFGSDSLWYGGPQWQIEALWRFEIPEEMRRRYGYPRLDHDAKRLILGLTSADLYGLAPGPVTERRRRHAGNHGRHDDRGRRKGEYHPVPENYEQLIPHDLKTLLEFPGFVNDNFSRMRRRYVEMGGGRTDTRHGWIRTRV
jgi:predicted TIM-barrel fold metal-dependent hydrolase